MRHYEVLGIHTSRSYQEAAVMFVTLQLRLSYSKAWAPAWQFSTSMNTLIGLARWR
jgi:hypothetical protein